MDNFPNQDMATYIEPRLGLLPALQQRILILRFGLKNERQHSLEEITQILEISIQRIRNEEAQALKTLRANR